MSGGKWCRWTEAERSRLFALRERRYHWDDIAREMKRTSGSCQQQYNLRKPEGTPRKTRSARVDVPPPAPAPRMPVLQAAPTPPSARRVSTHVLINDADLRARIAQQGLTAGLLGDPLPGRSALDQRNMGAGA